MSVAQGHLILVHWPVIGLPILAGVLAACLVWPTATLRRVAYVLLGVVVVLGSLAYLTGPPTDEEYTEQGILTAEAAEIVEDHGLLGRAVFTGLLLVGAVGLAFGLREARGEAPGRALLGIVLAAVLALAVLAGFTAHLGGSIRRPELRDHVYLEDSAGPADSKADSKADAEASPGNP